VNPPTGGPTIGSLCTGYGGLDMAVRQVFGGETVWHADIDPGASAILAHHWPHVPNLGDISAVDWSQRQPVDILTAGFPCQDVSLAGRRAGLAEGTRSGLWRQVARAIHELRPRLVVIENVRGLLSADAHGDVEPCPWCVGDDHGEPVLRALGAVLADLAGLGFDAEWQVVRASDVGAPHQRERAFVIAWPADAARQGLEGPHPGWRRAAGDGGAVADTDDIGGDGWSARAGQAGREVPAVNAPAHPGRGGRRPGVGDVQPGQPDPEGCAAADAAGDGHTHGPVGDPELQLVTEPGPGSGTDAGNPSPRTDGPLRSTSILGWGQYEPAVRRWEAVLGRPAPAAVDDRNRLNPAFVEWLMGLPAGHVTAVPGLSRTKQLKALGNGVVPQQAEAAIRLLLERVAADFTAA
jgi:DNA (cytosine-5)-methyltransferase 1